MCFCRGAGSASADTDDGRKLAQPIIPLIMCGGAGTRLWPASREGRPKQFLPLFGPLSTFQETMRRVADPALFGRPIVVTNGQYRFLVAEQLAEIGVEADILLEPARRDSGPAIAAGAGYALTRDGDAAGRRACRRSCRHRSARPSPRSARTARAAAEAGSDRHVRRRADARRRPSTATSGRGASLARGALRGREVRRKARRRDRGALRRRGLSVELRQLHVPRRASCSTNIAASSRDSAAAVAAAVDGRRHAISASSRSSADAFARAAREIDRLRGDGDARRARAVDAGVVRLVGCRLLAGGVGIVGARRRRQCRAGHGACSSTRASSYVASDKALVALLGVDNVVVVTTEDAVLVARREAATALRRRRRASSRRSRRR